MNVRNTRYALKQGVKTLGPFQTIGVNPSHIYSSSSLEAKANKNSTHKQLLLSVDKIAAA